MLQSNTSIDRQHGTQLPENLVLRGVLDVGLRGVEFLVLAGFAGEEDQAGLVGFEAGDVEREGFFVGRLAAGVDGDADRGGEFAGDVGFLWGEDVSCAHLMDSGCSPSHCASHLSPPL